MGVGALFCISVEAGLEAGQLWKFLAMIRISGPWLSSFVFPNDQEGLFHRLVLPVKWDFGSDDEFPQGPFRYGITLSFGAAVPGGGGRRIQLGGGEAPLLCGMNFGSEECGGYAGTVLLSQGL